jgi:hypothetical protein
MEATRSGARSAWLSATHPPKDTPTRCAGRSLSCRTVASSQAAHASGGVSGTRWTLAFGSPGMSMP